MANHYYNSNLETKSNERQFEFTLLSHKLLFYTDHGVFSKDTIDYGTRVLINHIHIESWYKQILDVGCGYGPIGISLAKEFSEVQFTLIDVNKRALNLARKNADSNKLKNISIFESNIYEKIHTKYDCIISNPPIRAGKKVVFGILDGAYEHLNDGGSIYIVIQKKQGAPSAKKKLIEIFGNCDVIGKDKGYYVLKAQKF